LPSEFASPAPAANVAPGQPIVSNDRETPQVDSGSAPSEPAIPHEESPQTADSASAVTAKSVRWNGPASYIHLKDPKDVTLNIEVTPRQKRQMSEVNSAMNNGDLRDDETGELLVASEQSKANVTPAENEAQIDHVYPSSKGGTRAFSNLQIRSRKNNRMKSNSLPNGQ
jgi:hypothetical protein